MKFLGMFGDGSAGAKGRGMQIKNIARNQMLSHGATQKWVVHESCKAICFPPSDLISPANMAVG